MGKNVLAYIIVLLLLFIILFYVVSYPTKNVYNGYAHYENNSSANGQKIIRLNANPFQYQFEGNSSHVYVLNGSISSFNLSLPSLNAVNSSVLAPISYYNNQIFIPLSSNSMGINLSKYWGGLAAVNATNGNFIWVDYFNNQIMTQPLVFNGIAYIGLGAAFYNPDKDTNGVIAVNATNGKIVWTRYMDSEHMPTFVYYNDTLVVTPGLGMPIDNSSGVLYFLNATSGKTIKEINTSSESAMSSILVVNDTAYFGTALFNFSSNSPIYQNNFKNAFYAIDLKNESILWSDKFNSSFGMQDSSPVFSNGLVMTGYSSSLFNNTISILGLNYSNGKMVWNFTSPERGNRSSPYIQLPPLTSYDGVLYSDSPTIGMLYALNASNGDLLWQFYTGPSVANVNVFNGSLLILNSQGYLFSINLNGKLLDKLYMRVPSGPENLVVIGNKLVVYGNSNKVIVLTLPLVNGT